MIPTRASLIYKAITKQSFPKVDIGVLLRKINGRNGDVG
jgi:hypothetical protein